MMTEKLKVGNGVGRARIVEIIPREEVDADCIRRIAQGGRRILEGENLRDFEGYKERSDPGAVYVVESADKSKGKNRGG